MSKPLAKLGKAWLIRWRFDSPDEDGALARLGINKKIVGFVTARKDIRAVVEYVTNIYKLTYLPFADQAFCEHYVNGEKNTKAMIKPIETHFTSDLYYRYRQSIEKHDINDERSKALFKDLQTYPQYVIIGHNPQLEGIKVSHLNVFLEDGEEILEWEERMIDGSQKHMTWRASHS